MSLASGASSPLQVLRGYAPFHALSGAALSRLLARMEEVEFQPGTCLTRIGEPANAAWLIVDGEAEQFRNGARIALLEAEAITGTEAVGLQTYVHTVRALTPVRAWRLPRAALAELAAGAPGLEAALVHAAFAAPDEDLSLPSATAASLPTVSTKSLIGWFVALVLPPLVFLASDRSDLSLQASIFMAIFSAVITMWVFSLVDDFVPPLLALVYMLFIGLAPPSVVLSSFASPSLMILLGVFALAAMLTTSGLSNRLLLWLLLKLPNRTGWHQATLLFYGLVLSLGTPSGNNRMALMLPAFNDMGHGLRLAHRSAAMTALFVATYGGSMLFSSTFATSKSATISVFGLLPYHLQDFFGGLFWVSAAAGTSIFLIVMHIVASRLMFRNAESGEVSRALLADRLGALGPMSNAEKVTAVCFVTFLVGSMSAGAHHVSPAAVAGIIMIGLLLTGTMTRADVQRNIDWPMIIFLITSDCLIKVMEYLGLSAQLAASLRDLTSFIDGDMVRFLLLSLVVVVALRLLFPIAAGMLLSAVILLPIAQSEGINLWICIFSIALFSDIWFFRYQNSIYMIAVNAGVLSQIDEKSFLRHNVVMNLARMVAPFVSLPLWYAMGIA
jgi:DASS family divalent anion:Na+ symporter